MEVAGDILREFQSKIRPKARQEGDYTIIEGQCRVTKKPYSVRVLTTEYQAWRNGTFIQDAMPNTSTDDREFILSGISPEGWNSI